MVPISEVGNRFGKLVESQEARLVAVGPPFRLLIRACPFLLAQKPIVAVSRLETRGVRLEDLFLLLTGREYREE